MLVARAVFRRATGAPAFAEATADKPERNDSGTCSLPAEALAKAGATAMGGPAGRSPPDVVSLSPARTRGRGPLVIHGSQATLFIGQNNTLKPPKAGGLFFGRAVKFKGAPRTVRRKHSLGWCTLRQKVFTQTG